MCIKGEKRTNDKQIENKPCNCYPEVSQHDTNAGIGIFIKYVLFQVGRVYCDMNNIFKNLEILLPFLFYYCSFNSYAIRSSN